MIYFVRHGQTDDNKNGNFTGWNSTPLNQNGIEQAKQTAEKLKDIKFDVCFCSPLKRTQQTLAQILQFHKDLKIVFDDRIKERDYGEITGKPKTICKFNRWDATQNIPFEMETVLQFFERVSDFYNFLKKDYTGKNILIVSHSGVARMTHFYFAGKPKNDDYSDFKIDNANVMEIDF